MKYTIINNNQPFMQNHSSTMQLTSPISSENLIQSRLCELGLQSLDVGGTGDCLFRSVSHQLYVYTYYWGSIYERQPRENLLRAILKIHG